MNKTRLSLFYLAGYLIPAGVGLLTVPHLFIKLLLSNRDYDGQPLRLLGAVLFVLGVIVVQIIRHRLDVLYPTTLGVRLFLLAVLIALYVRSMNPLWLVITCIVALGVALTGTSYLMERKAGAAPASPAP